MSKKEKTVITPVPANPTGPVAIISKVPFDDVEHVFHATHSAFHAEGFFNDLDAEVDDRFLAIWHTFLLLAGWTEDEFWEANENQAHTCPECAKEMEEHDEEDLTLPETKMQVEDKPN
jgi:hypothetical protein